MAKVELVSLIYKLTKNIPNDFNVQKVGSGLWNRIVKPLSEHFPPLFEQYTGVPY